LLESDPVLGVDLRLVERRDDLVLSRLEVGEPLALSRVDHGVFRELDHHEEVERDEVLLVGLVLLGSLVVDVGQEDALIEVLVVVERVLPVLGLNEVILHEVHVDSEVDELLGDLAQGLVLSRAARESIDALVLSSESDEVVNWRNIVSLHVSTNEMHSD